MEHSMGIIPVFFATDDIYAPCLAVAIKSMIENASKKYFYVIKILNTNISDKNKKLLMRYVSPNVSIEFVDLSYYIDKIKDKLYTRDYYTATTYFRLFMPELYPQYDKAIYLDSDIVVLGDISELYNEKLGNNLIGAAPDNCIQTMAVFQEYAEKVVGVSSYRYYFNAGVLLMNLDELRKFKFQEKFLYLLSTVKYTVAQDQDYLNRLVKGRVKIIDDAWDVMPLPTTPDFEEKDIKIVHYNLIYKPWHRKTRYEDIFWRYAKKTDYYENLKKQKENYTEDQRFDDMERFKKLQNLAITESNCVGDDRKWNILSGKKPVVVDRDPERLKVLEKIEKMEENGIFDIDAEEDPPTIELEPEDIDYLRKNYYGKIKRILANNIGKRYIKNLIKKDKLIIKQVNGIENLKGTKGGAIITCNHFNPYDSLAIEKVFLDNHMFWWNRKLYKVIREGNYTNFNGLYGFFFKNCDTLPLSSNKDTMVKFLKAVDIILKKGDFILIYPEQSMWWNYRKPKPLKNGGFKLAARNMKPVIPIFITMNDSKKLGEDGFPIQEYTINIAKPIYPDKNLSEKENAEIMKNKNFEVWKNIYEDFYNIPLKYNTKTEVKEIKEEKEDKRKEKDKNKVKKNGKN